MDPLNSEYGRRSIWGGMTVGILGLWKEDTAELEGSEDPHDRGAWGAQLAKHPILAQVRISELEFQPCVGLCADSSEPGAPDFVSLSLSLSAPSLLMLCLSKVNTHLKNKNKKERANVVGIHETGYRTLPKGSFRLPYHSP